MASSNLSGSRMPRGRTTLKICSKFIRGKRTNDTTVCKHISKRSESYRTEHWNDRMIWYNETLTVVSAVSLYWHHAWTALKISISWAKNESRCRRLHRELCDIHFNVGWDNTLLALRSINVIHTLVNVSKLYSRAASKIAQQFSSDNFFFK